MSALIAGMAWWALHQSGNLDAPGSKARQHLPAAVGQVDGRIAAVMEESHIKGQRVPPTRQWAVDEQSLRVKE